jgi:hypothetical protein
MNRTDCIELANQLTERKGEKILDLELLYASTVQDICKRNRFWWRKLDVTFSLNQGQTNYDFTQILPTLATPLPEIAVEEITHLAIILQAANPFQDTELTPIFDALGIRQMKNNTVQAQPSRYLVGVDDWKTLRVDPPDRTYLAEMTFWAMPMISKDQSSNTVPLIPPYYHNAIVEGLEARINRRVYGPNDSRFLGAQQAYENSILTMTMRPQFTSNMNKQWINDDPTGYVQSTAPNTP